jgi:hypothetical protein
MLEINLDGEVTRELCASRTATCSGGQARNMSRLLHHDAFKIDDRRYAVLTVEVVGFDCDGIPFTPDTQITIDGVSYVEITGPTSTSWLAESSMTEWQFTDIYSTACTDYGAPANYWNGILIRDGDWVSPNSLHVDDDGDWTISLRAIDRIVHVFGPDHVSAGQLDWSLDNGSVSDFTNLTTEEFCGQHHVEPVTSETGELSLVMFDNYFSGSSSVECNCRGGGCARGLEVDLDLDTMEITAINSWDMGLTCTTTGSTDLTSSGNALNTCGPKGVIAEMDATGAAVWALTVNCLDPSTGAADPQILYRSAPVSGL